MERTGMHGKREVGDSGGKRMYEDAGEQEVDGERTVPVLHRERTL